MNEIESDKTSEERVLNILTVNCSIDETKANYFFQAKIS